MSYRIESDLIGEIKVPKEAYYGVQTQRAIDNFHISGSKMGDYPEFVKAIAYVKLAALKANDELGLLPKEIIKPVTQACQEIIDGKFADQFRVDMFQGGAGTSVNMNANEVIANRALEIMGKEKGDYQYCWPNDHINCSQSTNDSYPTTIKLAIIRMNHTLVKHLEELVAAFRAKSKEFSSIIKMGRTQLQDAVPMTLGQEFEAFADSLAGEVKMLNNAASLLLEINMGGTAIGTGINAHPKYAKLCAQRLAEVSGEAFVPSANFIEATPDTSTYVSYSSALKRLAVKLSKICNDLRLLASGPRAGLREINLPAMQPGSSIMPGKVNPVIPEVVNQVCFKIIGNDLAVAFAAEAGQLELNVMEPVICQCILESIVYMERSFDTLKDKCVVGITANKEVCLDMVKNSIGIVTALNPYIGYKNSTKIAKEALETGKAVYDLVLEHKLLTKEKLDSILDPKNMLTSHEFNK